MPRTDLEQLVYTMSVKVDTLQKQLSRAVGDTDKASGQIERRLKKVGSTKVDLAKSLNTAKIATLQQLAPGADRYATALSGLGVAGIAAGVGIAAAAVAMNQAREALAFADEIGDTAQRIGVSTDVLQQYRYAIHQVGGEAHDADEALAEFSKNLGKASSPLATRKSTKPYEVLGLDPKALGDANQALDTVLAALGRVRDESQRQALAKALGLEKFIPLAREGAGRIDELKAAADRLGYVLDAEVIRKAGPANDELEDLAVVTKNQLTVAFVEFAPVVLGVAQAIANTARFVGGLSKDIAAILPVMQRWAEKLGPVAKLLGFINGLNPANASVKAIGKGIEAVVGAARRANVRSGVNDLLAGQTLSAADRAALAPPAPPPPPLDLQTPGGGGSGKSKRDVDRTAAAAADARQALDTATRDMLDVMAGLTGNLDQRAELEKSALFADLRLKNQGLEEQKRKNDLDADISEARKAELADTLDQAQLTNLAVANARAAEIDRQAAADVEERIFRDRQEIAGYYNEILAIDAGLVGTARERRAVELKLLKHRQDEERAALKLKLAAEVAAGKDPSQARAELASQLDLFDRQRDQVFRSTETSAERFQRENSDPALAAERFQDAGVRAFESLSDGLADAIVNARSLGDVAKNVFRQLIAEILAQNIRSGIASLAGFIPGFAGGTGSAPGGLAWVGEHGRELVNLPRGSQVMPHHETLRIGRVQPSAPAAGPSQFFDLRGALIDKDVYADMQAIADRAAGNAERRAVSRAMSASNTVAPGRLDRLAKLGT